MILLTNAIKFTDMGGQININCKVIQSADNLTIKDQAFILAMQLTQGRKYLEVEVNDTGIGITDQDKSKLFKLFGFLEVGQQVSSKGIGLGLYISKMITKMYDGEIICRSQYGQGTQFIFIV